MDCRRASAKETLRRVKPAVADGPRGMDSHLKAYERAQQMLADLESEIMQKAGDSVLEQSRAFNILLGSSSIWQPQPCRETFSSQPNTKTQDEFPDENTNSNISQTNNGGFGNQNFPPKPNGGFFNLANSLKAGETRMISSKTNIQERENKMLRRSLSFEKPLDTSADFLPDDKDFEDAIISAVLNTIETENSAVKNKSKKVELKAAAAADKRLKVFQDITLSLSPRA